MSEKIILTLSVDRDIAWRGMTSLLEFDALGLFLGILIGITGIVAAPIAAGYLHNVGPHPALYTSAFFGAVACWIYLCGWTANRNRSLLLKLYDAAQERIGPYQATFDTMGVTFEGRTSHQRFSWNHIDKIKSLKEASGLVSGTFIFVVPDRDLPEGLSPVDFRNQLEAWRTGT